MGRKHSTTLAASFALVGVVTAGALVRSDVPVEEGYVEIDALAACTVAYCESVEKSLASAEAYADAEERVVKEANVLMALAGALGQHPGDHELKPAADRIVAAAVAVAEADGFEAAKEAAAGLDLDALTGDATEADASDAELSLLMNEVARLFSGLRRSSQGSRLERRRDANIENSTTIAVVADTASRNVDYCEDDDQLAVWQKWALEMRAAAGQLAAAAREADAELASDAFKRLDKSCVECHKAFNVEE